MRAAPFKTKEDKIFLLLKRTRQYRNEVKKHRVKKISKNESNLFTYGTWSLFLRMTSSVALVHEDETRLFVVGGNVDRRESR